MASLVFVPGRMACFTLTIWLLAAQEAVSSRGPVGWNFDADVDDFNDKCVKVDNRDREKIVTQIPPNVYLLLEKRNLKHEYYALTDSLYDAPQGKMGAWKSSALYRTMYVRGHEAAFKAKNVDIYLTYKHKLGSSIIKICFVDRLEEPDYMPTDIYSDVWKGFDFKKGKVCKKVSDGELSEGMPSCNLGQRPKGVYGQVYDEYPDVQSDKMEMPVDLLKFLEKKDLVLENMDMAALINTGDKSGFSAAQVVVDFKEKFFAKGVKLFYCQKAFRLEENTEWHHWFEYADIEVVGKGYTPTVDNKNVEYPQPFLRMYNECKDGNPKYLASYINKREGDRLWQGCGDVAGAVQRTKLEAPNCKCNDKDAKVFCGDKRVASRKFDIEQVISLKDCAKGLAYCSVKACLPPDDRP